VSEPGPRPAAPYGDFQLEIYLAGLGGTVPSLPVSFAELEARAERALSPSVWSYAAGGAGDERTQRANVAAFDQWGLMPRMLVGAIERDLSVDLFGHRLPSPLFLAPIGVIGLCAQDGHGDLATAQAAARLGVPMVASTLSADPMEDVAGQFGETPGFFQLYTPTDRELAASLVHRAEEAGFAGIVVTLDTWVTGWRPRDLATSNFPQLRGLCLANYTADPVFRSRLAQPPQENPMAAVAHWAGIFGNPLTWDDLPWLRSLTSLPLILKGICHPDDARRALDGGADAVYVSNHGGRPGLPARRGRGGGRPPGALRLRCPLRRRHREGPGAGRDRRRHRPPLRLRPGPRRRGRRRARAAHLAGRGRPDHGR
jgi:lactate 2-monooxygenase